jgi:uncharacterized repeat protein (TIGR01451 family)
VKAGTRFGAALVAAAVLSCAFAAQASATTFAVNTTDDSSDAGGCVSISVCSLRDAVDAVNAGTGGDTITIPGGTYLLKLGELAVSESVTISGAGAKATTIDGNNSSRVFDIGSGAAVSISGVTITHGAATASSPTLKGDGGGIVTFATSLTLDDVALTANSATFGGAGLDAPFESGSSTAVTITNSVVSDNRVSGGAGNGQGGGLAVFGPLTMTNVTIAGNSVQNAGPNEGGGLVASRNATDTSMPKDTLLNVTIAGNSVSGAGFGGGLSGDNLLGGGPFASNLFAENTIIAGNTVGGATHDCEFVSTARTDHNLSSDATCGFSDAGSRQNTNPQLGTLENADSDTAVLPLLAGSPAINAGDNSGCPSTDQRGVSRPQAAVCDIGAYELVWMSDLALAIGAAPNPAVTGSPLTYTITVTNNGPQPAAGVTVTDPLPAGVTLKSASASCAGAPLVCHLADLAPGATEALTLVTTAQKAGHVTNAATVNGAYGDPNPANNTASVTTAVRRPTADVSVSDRPSRRLLTVGDRVTFTLTVRNHGPDAASGLALTELPASGLRIVSVGGAKKCHRLRCTLRNLPSGKSLRVRVVAVATASGRQANTVRVKAAQVDPRRSNNRSVVRVSVRPVPQPHFTG